MNSINIIGRLTADPELKQTQSGIDVCSFRIAVNRPGTKDKTDFLPCVAWRQTAEFVNRYFTKGKMIALSGVLTSRQYEDQDGHKRTAYEVVADRVFFTGDGAKRDEQHEPEVDVPSRSGSAIGFTQGDFTEIDGIDDLPF